MNAPSPSHVSVTVNSTFWDLYTASLMQIRYEREQIVLHLLFPLTGLIIIVAAFWTGSSLSVDEVIIVLLLFSYTPLETFAASVKMWMARRRNKLAQGPITFGFDSEGLHVSGVAFDSAIKWTAITRVRQSKHFLFIFTSTYSPLYIPVKTLTDQGVLDDVRTIVREHTDLPQ